MEDVLSVEQIKASYELGDRRLQVLHGIDFSVQAGEIVAIKGPSGSGKSTLLHILGLLARADSGHYRLCGHDVSRLSALEAAAMRSRYIGFVFQQFHLVPKTSVLANILLPTYYPAELATTSSLQKQKAIQLAERLGLGEQLSKHPNQLSGGQQQRVAIARALINDAPIILADEPTGNLDTRTAGEILNLFKELRAEGKTIVIITHDPKVAETCDRTVEIIDGEIRQAERSEALKSNTSTAPERLIASAGGFKLARNVLPMAVRNIWRQKMRSTATMLGVVIGIASVAAMVTLGDFAKERILETYTTLGVNRLQLRGQKNWRLEAKDKVGLVFSGFDVESDLKPLGSILPDVQLYSPQVWAGDRKALFGGKSLDEVTVRGVGASYFRLANRELTAGSEFSEYHIRSRVPVCVIGSEVQRELFRTSPALGALVYLSDRETSMGCRVIGVMGRVKSGSGRGDPNKAVVMPYSYILAMARYPWQRQIRSVILELRDGSDVERAAKEIEGFFQLKYGKTGEFWVDNDDILLAQVNKFLIVFTTLLASVAFLSLVVGGVGITNMMLVSVSERLRELGLRKALGATGAAVRWQVLGESVILCGVAGVIGLVVGFVAYQTVIYAVANFTQKFEFEWLINPTALLLSSVSIFAVGVISGIIPALKAERLEVIEALRSE